MAQQNSPFSLIDPTIAGDQIGIDRQRALAQMLLQKGNEDIQPQVAGGYVVPISPWQTFGKAAMMGAGGYANAKSDQTQRDLAIRQSKMLIDMLRGSHAGETPNTVPTDNGMQNSENQPISNPIGSAPSQDNGFAPRGMPDNQRLLAYALDPSAYATASLKQYEPTDLMKMMRSAGIDESSALGKQLLQANIAKQNYIAPTSGRPGGYLQDSTGNLKFLPKLPDNSMPIDPNNPSAGIVPIQGGAAVTQANAMAEASGKAAGGMPYNMNLMDVPVYLPGGDQINVKMNANQAHQYTTTGQLPPEIAQSIPGLNQPQGQNQAQPMPQGQPMTQGQPQTSSQIPAAQPQDVNNMKSMLGVYQRELQNPNNSPEDKAYLTNKIGTLQQAINSTQPSGGAVVGRTQSQAEQITQQRQQAGGKATDEQFAKDYVSFTTGGVQDATKQLAQLQDTLNALKTPNANLTGPMIGKIPDSVLNVVNPNSVAMRERVEEVVQRSLRAILGSQFTEKEGERLIARAYNPNQPEAENAIRVQRLYTQLQSALQAKQDAAAYFQKNGTLQGWQGKLPSMGDFSPSAGQPIPSTNGWSIKKVQ